MGASAVPSCPAPVSSGGPWPRRALICSRLGRVSLQRYLAVGLLHWEVWEGFCLEPVSFQGDRQRGEMV